MMHTTYNQTNTIVLLNPMDNANIHILNKQQYVFICFSFFFFLAIFYSVLFLYIYIFVILCVHTCKIQPLVILQNNLLIIYHK